MAFDINSGRHRILNTPTVITDVSASVTNRAVLVSFQKELL
jgi:hypothetical protein